MVAMPALDGVEHRYVGTAEGGSGSGLAHSNPAGQAENYHSEIRSSATKRRNSSSTSGFTPNHS